MALTFNHDKNKSNGAEEKFKEIAGAYDILCDRNKRLILDREKGLKQGISTNVSQSKQRGGRNRSKNNRLHCGVNIHQVLSMNTNARALADPQFVQASNIDIPSWAKISVKAQRNQKRRQYKKTQNLVMEAKLADEKLTEANSGIEVTEKAWTLGSSTSTYSQANVAGVPLYKQPSAKLSTCMMEPEATIPGNNTSLPARTYGHGIIIRVSAHHSKYFTGEYEQFISNIHVLNDFTYSRWKLLHTQPFEDTVHKSKGTCFWISLDHQSFQVLEEQRMVFFWQCTTLVATITTFLPQTIRLNAQQPELAQE